MKPKNIIADLRVYGKSYMRAKSSLFFAFLFPAIIMIIFGSIFLGPSSGGSSSIPLYIQNLDHNSSVSETFISSINDSNMVKIIYVPGDINITSYISQNSISAALVIPDGFQNSYMNHSAVNIAYYYNPADSTSGTLLTIIQNAEMNFNSNFTAINGPIYLKTSTVSPKATGSSDYLIPGLIGFVILTAPMFSMTYVVSSYKKEKIFRQLSLTPLTKSEWYVSKFLWYLIVSAISAAEIISIGYFMFNSRIEISLAMIPFIILGVFLFTSLGVLAGSISKTEEGASVLGNIITFPMMFLAGTFFPVSIMPSWLQTIAHGLPLFYIIDGLNSVMIYSNSASAIRDIIISVIVSIVIFSITYAAFNWKEEKIQAGRLKTES